jgi:hypothetical protein
MIRLFITKAAANAVILEERLFMCVSLGKRLSSILTCRTQQGPCQLQKPEKKPHFNADFSGAGRAQVAADTFADTVRGQGGHTR